MSAVSGLEHLPIDAVENIANYLSPIDLSNCCAVNRTWHVIFNSDTLWRKRFNKIIADYLKVAKCQVEPVFSSLSEVSSPRLPISCYRENYLKEARLWKNWRNGKFKLEEIEFELDDSISYGINVEFLNNDHVLLHRTFQTEVWDVSQEPNLVLEIPFNLNELWEDNLFNFVENKLVVVQCNVVQVFSICLESKTSYLNHVFYFDQNEEFSSLNISDGTSINEAFLKTSFNDFERVICGIYFVGIVSTDDKKLTLHVWNVINGKKLKEENCPALPSDPLNITLKVDENSQDKVLVVFDFLKPNRISSVFLYDLEKLHFVADSKVLCSGDFTLFDKYLFALTCDTLTVYDYENDRISLKNKGPIILNTFKCQNLASLHIFKNKVLVFDNSEILCIDPEKAHSNKVNALAKVDFACFGLEVIQDRFLAFNDKDCSLKEIWEVGEITKKVISLPDDSGIYRAVNSACSRVVLERGNKLIVLNFW